MAINQRFLELLPLYMKCCLRKTDFFDSLVREKSPNLISDTATVLFYFTRAVSVCLAIARQLAADVNAVKGLLLQSSGVCLDGCIVVAI